MLTIAKGAIEGAWTLIVGWVLPCAASLLLFEVLVFPTLGGATITKTVSGLLGEDGALLLLAAVVMGWFLSTLSTPLYRVLEGYKGWPKTLRDSRIRHHQRERTQRKATADRAIEGSIECAQAYEELYKYPLAPGQVLPTRLGNAIRAFECYGQDRYQLDAVRLWPHLVSCSPDALTTETNKARSEVDFFICLFYTQLMVSIAAAITLIAQPGAWRQLVSATLVGLMVAALSYQGAVSATNSWSAAVRAIVDLSRGALAAAYGLAIPESVEDERRMWEYLSWYLGYPYTPESARRMNEFRVRKAPGGPGAPQAVEDLRSDRPGAHSLYISLDGRANGRSRRFKRRATRL